MTVYGNTAAKAAIDAAIQSGRLSHAYLFYGEAGTGKRSMARLFAQSLLCEGEPVPCGACLPCRKLMAGVHPDVTVLDGSAAQIKVDDVRRCKIAAQVRPNESRYRLFEILETDHMTVEAANALLKLLEEPPAHAIFLLTVQNKDALPATVVSRCFAVPCTSLGMEDCVKALLEHCPDADGEAIRRAAKEANGNVGRAIALLTGSDKDATRFAAVCDALEQKRELPLLRAFYAYEKDGDAFLLACRALADRAADAAACKAGHRAGPLSQYTVGQLLQMEALFRQAEERLNNAANKSLTAAWLPAMLIRLCSGK